jgi:dTDP-4-amino-4,6-dideoxygalactose transaminase
VPQKVPQNADSVYWKFCVNVDESAAGATLSDIAARMKANGIFTVPRYIGKPAFECQIFREKKTFGDSSWPYTDSSRAGLPPVDHDRKNFPGTVKALSQVLVIPWNEFYTDEHVDYIADRLRAAVSVEVA